MIDFSAKLIQAEKEIKENLKDFDIFTEFLGERKKYFIREYSNFSSQLNEGDKLIVRISIGSEYIREGDYGDDYVYFPSFDIILLKSDGKTKILGD